MRAELTAGQLAARSAFKKYRKEIWNPFIGAVRRYGLIEEGDRIAVCISGGKDSALLAVLLKELCKFSEVPFSLVFLAMDPGYAPETRALIENNAKLLEFPLSFFETDIFEAAEKAGKSACYICARMRRGHLYAKAQELNCNKIALGHHFSDVVETTVLALFYGSQIQSIPPKLKSANFEGMQLIRPLYCIHEDDIKKWQRYNGLHFTDCSCGFSADSENSSKREEIKELLRELKKTNPNIEKSIFAAVHNVCLDTVVGYKLKGVRHSFSENL